MGIGVGVAEVSVPVPVGTPMAGYAARVGASVAVAEPLTVRALVLDGVALLTADVCALHERTIAQIRDGAAGHVRDCIVTATHTHSGPCVAFGRLGPHAAGVHDALVAAALAAVRAAAAEQRVCSVGWGRASGAGIARNRRHPDVASDPPVQFLRFDDGAATRAWLVTYPCHPVVLDGANRQISGDYPAAVRARLEQAAPGSSAVFATGAAGDQNPGAFTPEDSFTTGATGGRGLDEAARVGGLLADAVLGARVAPVPADAVRLTSEAVALPFERVPAQRARRERASWQEELAGTLPRERRALLEAWSAWADDLLAGRLDALGAAWPGTVTALELGPVRVVALPGEPFLASAERIDRGSEGPVLVLGYGNGCPGYLPPREEYAHGGYEVADAHRYYGMPGPFAAGSAEQVEAAALRALARLACR